MEKVFSDLEIEEDLQAKLLRPNLTGSARNIVARMDATDADNYDKVRETLLREYKLTPAALFNRFNSSSQGTAETYTVYSNRLFSLLEYYFQAREVEDLKQVTDLIVCDKIKSSLAHTCCDISYR